VAGGWRVKLSVKCLDVGSRNWLSSSLGSRCELRQSPWQAILLNKTLLPLVQSDHLLVDGYRGLPGQRFKARLVVEQRVTNEGRGWQVDPLRCFLLVGLVFF